MATSRVAHKPRLPARIRRRAFTYGRPLLLLLKKTIQKWNEDPVLRLGAALGYYAAFSIVPLLVLTMMAAGQIVGHERAEHHLLLQLQEFVGHDSAETLRKIVEHWHDAASRWLGFIVTIITLLFAATGAFDQVQDALNTIWGVKPKERRGLLGTLRRRFLSLLGLLGTGFLLLVSMTVTATLGGVMPFILSHVPGPAVLTRFLSSVMSFGFLTVLFAMIFKLLPRARVAWSDVWVGSLVTAALFMLGKMAIVVYLGHTLLLSLYGPAGILVIVLLWSFFASQVLLFGAEFTALYASEYGSHVLPTPDADAISDPARHDAARDHHGNETEGQRRAR